jgi:hypothetical protein
VHHDGSEALVKWALVERLIGLALGARQVSEGVQAGNLFALIASARVQLAQAAKLGAGIVQLAAQLSPLRP